MGGKEAERDPEALEMVALEPQRDVNPARRGSTIRGGGGGGGEVPFGVGSSTLGTRWSEASLEGEGAGAGRRGMGRIGEGVRSALGATRLRLPGWARAEGASHGDGLGRIGIEDGEGGVREDRELGGRPDRRGGV